jgi:hypothetical protein
MFQRVEVEILCFDVVFAFEIGHDLAFLIADRFWPSK